MNLSGLAQFIFGFLIGVLILTGAGAATAYWFFNRMSDTPAEPNFSEKPASQNTKPTKQSQSDSKPSSSQANKSSEQTASNSSQQSENQTSDQSQQSENTTNEEQSQQSKSEPTLQERFGKQAYKARVVWPEGLSLRDRPSINSSRIGGVYYNDKLVIIEKSSDGDWQKVYVPETGQKAWVKAGNVEKIN